MQDDEKIECLMSLQEVSEREFEKEFKEGENVKIQVYYKTLLQHVSEKTMNLNGKDSRLDNDRKTNQDLLQLYFDQQTTYYDIDNARQMMNSKPREHLNQIEKNS